MTANARFDVFPMVLPEMGPRSVPDRIDFVANEAIELDLSQLINNGWLDYVSGVYVDNFGNSGNVMLVCGGTNQRFVIPANSAGYFPLFLPNPPKVMLSNTASETVTFQWYNVPVFPVSISGEPALSNVNISQVGGNAVTTEIPVSISAPVTIEPAPVTIVDYTLNLAGGDEEIVAAGDASNYLVIQNPSGNNPVTINISGGDSTVNGFVLTAGGQYECNRGLTNAVHGSGTATQKLIVFAG